MARSHKRKKAPRNAVLGYIAHNDPARYRGRMVETEKRKLVKSRARRKEAERREEENDA